MKQNYSCAFPKAESRKKHSIKKTILGLSFLITGCGLGNAQVKNYSFSQSTGTFTPISGTALMTATANATTPAPTPNLNSRVEELIFPTGFTFNFNGVNYTKANVSSNGYITFGDTAPSITSTSPINSTAAYDGVISVFGRDISSYFELGNPPVSGKIQYYLDNSGSNPELVIEWTNFRVNSSVSTTALHNFSFQVRLEQGTNVIKMVYGPNALILGTNTTSGTVQIGLRGETTADYNNRLNASGIAFIDSTPGTTVSSTQYISTTTTNASGMPPAGFTYTWTPPTCYAPKNINVDSNSITTNSATLNWAAPIPASSAYDVYYSTTPTAPDATTAPSVSNVTATTLNLTNLQTGTDYYVWVRSHCSSSTGAEWVGGVKFSTVCGPVTSYYNGFETTASGNNLPTCWTRLAIATAGSQSISTTTPAVGKNSLYIGTGSSTTTNPVVAILPEFNNLNDGTHWLRFRARVVSGTGTLKVGYITDFANPSTFVLIQDLLVSNTAWSYPSDEITVVIPSAMLSNIPADARLAFTTINEGKYFYIDELYWEPIPSCMAPEAVTVGTKTSSTAVISWNASMTPAVGGYDIYYSVNDTPPTSTTSPLISGVLGTSTMITGLNPLTKYFVWLRSNCGTDGFSEWMLTPLSFYTDCVAPALLSSSGATLCVGDTATLTASVETGANAVWYNAPTGGNQLYTGNAFTTPSLSTTTSYYVASSSVSTLDTGGKSAPVASATSGSGTTNVGIIFDVLSPSTIETVTIYPTSSTAGQAGTVTIDVVDVSMNVMASKTVDVITGSTSAPAPMDVQLNFQIPIGTNYKMRMSSKSSTVSGLLFDPATQAPNGDYGYPMAIGSSVNIITSTLTANNTARNDLYYYFYNWKVRSWCESPRVEVIATIDANCLSTSEVEKKNQIKVYPNPFTDFIDINTPELVKVITVSDISGRALKTINQPKSRLRLDGFSQGMYILLLEMKDGSKQSIKIIKK